MYGERKRTMSGKATYKQKDIVLTKFQQPLLKVRFFLHNLIVLLLLTIQILCQSVLYLFLILLILVQNRLEVLPHLLGTVQKNNDSCNRFYLLLLQMPKKYFYLFYLLEYL